MESIDLLPSPGLGSEWTKSLPTDEGRESDQIFEFDGVSTAVTIPPEVIHHGLPPTFTIATWMKHKDTPDQDRHVKEHVICSADNHSKKCKCLDFMQSFHISSTFILVLSYFMRSDFFHGKLLPIII